MKRAILINDTSLVFHYGCQLVMENIRKGLKNNSISVKKSFLFTEKGITAKLVQYLSNNNIEYVIINGEGSIHHNRPLANELISLGKNIKEHFPKMKVVLLNSTIQEMGDDINLLTYFDLINIRESKSQRYLQDHGIESILTPDLSIYNKRTIYGKQKKKSIVIGGSVIDKKMSENIHFANKNNLYFRDILYIPKGSNLNPINVLKKIYYIAIKIINYHFNWKLLIKSSQGEISKLSKYEILISGRFHDIYLAILAGVDIYILSSNSYKIEGTLNDIGLENKVFESINDIDFNDIGYSQEEKDKINAFYSQGYKKIDNLFSTINNL